MSLWLYAEKNSPRRCSAKKVFLEISENPRENTSAKVGFFNKVAGLAKFLRTPFLTEHLRATASKV